MKLDVYNLQGKKSGTYDLPDTLFNLPYNETLVHQVYVAKWNNTRRPYAHAKTRAEVRGGGRKPWRQKGTGRARHGSTRSPIWVGGGVTFGPRNEINYKRKVNKKMNQKAIFTVLSSKAQGKNIFVIETLKFGEPKTKFGADLLNTLKIDEKSNVVYGSVKDKNFKRVFANIPRTVPMSLENLNIVDLLQKQNVIFSKSSLDELIKTYKDKIKSDLPLRKTSVKQGETKAKKSLATAK